MPLVKNKIVLKNFTGDLGQIKCILVSCIKFTVNPKVQIRGGEKSLTRVVSWYSQTCCARFPFSYSCQREMYLLLRVARTMLQNVFNMTIVNMSLMMLAILDATTILDTNSNLPSAIVSNNQQYSAHRPISKTAGCL